MSQFSKKTTLTNGLSVIYEKFDQANIVSIHLGIKIGSVNETNQQSGMCHLIEHLVFKGTKSYQAGEIATLVEAHGGELNAYTSWDQTVYYINLPSDHFSLGLNIVKEMAFDATFDPVEIDREKEVVIEEILRSQDNPHRVLSDLLFSHFYQKHPYGRPIIGTKELVKNFSRDDIVSFYNKYYCPQNMVLAVCGNIDESTLNQGLENTFRHAINAPQTHNTLTEEPAKTTYQILTHKMDINATHLELAFAAPELAHPDVPAMDVLSHLLGEAETSLLEQNTKEKEQLVHNIYSTCYTPRYPGVFIISCQLNPQQITPALLSICKQIDHVKAIPFEEEKIERAKLLAKAQLVYERQTCEGTARKWITYEILSGNYRFDEAYIETVSKLTASDIQKAANTYLDMSKATLAIVLPKKSAIRINKNVFAHKPDAFAKKRQPKQRLQDTFLYKLDNGVRVIVKENHRLPLVSIKTASLGGLRYETARNNGINHLLSSIITRSTVTLNQEQLAEKCEWLGGHLGGYTGRNSFGLSFSFLSEKRHQAIPVFSDVILHPAFAKTEISKEKKLMLESIKNRSDNPAQTAFSLLLKHLFRGHPYQLHPLGEKLSINALSLEQLKKYYQLIMTPQNLVIAVTGDVNTQEILELLNDQLACLKKSAFHKINLSKPNRPHDHPVLFKNQKKEQTHVAIGFLSTSLYDQDKYAMEILSNILSGQGGRLFLELRDKQSLAYTVSTTLIEGLETGFFGAYIATEPSKADTAIKGIFKELDQLRDTEISQTELDRAKNYIIGNQEIENQKISAIAMQLALNEIYGQGMEEWYEFTNRIKKVTTAQIQQAAQKYLRPERSITAITGPMKCRGES